MSSLKCVMEVIKFFIVAISFVRMQWNFVHKIKTFQNRSVLNLLFLSLLFFVYLFLYFQKLNFQHSPKWFLIC